MNIWALCDGPLQIRPLSVYAWRVVEAQHVLSSRDLVDNREEHDVLELMLEETKPVIDKHTHYLIFTPFRYPPLKYGSRFGRMYEPSLWYGSRELKTALAEVSYYRLQFLRDSDAKLGYLETSMTAFSVCISTDQGIFLTEDPFKPYTRFISHQDIYTDSQILGSAMRKANVDAFLYYSARAANCSENIAAYSSSVFECKKKQYIQAQQTWLCLANTDAIEWTSMDAIQHQRYLFSSEQTSQLFLHI